MARCKRVMLWSACAGVLLGSAPVAAAATCSSDQFGNKVCAVGFSAAPGQTFSGVVGTYSAAAGFSLNGPATISWGDGTSSSGTDSGGDVSGSHAYSVAGTYAVSVEQEFVCTSPGLTCGNIIGIGGSGVTGEAAAAIKNVTSIDVSAPETGDALTAIPASAIASALLGATSGSGGTIAFKVFGPQSTPPADCANGGITVGVVRVGGNGTYNPPAGFSPPSAGTYWWYASYSGDPDDDPASSVCGASMTHTAVAPAPTTTPPGAPGPAGSPRPSCSIRPRSNRVELSRGKSHAHHPKRPAATLSFLVRCDQPARLRLVATVTATGLPTRPHTRKRFSVRASGVLQAGDAEVILTIRLPTVALAALKARAHESVALMLTATNANGTAKTTATIGRLRLRRPS